MESALYDFISDLPHGIIESILMRMPIRDAVRTSVLSSKWRYRWTKITSLVFDDELHHEEVEQANIEKFITHTLLLHKGPIHKFELSVSTLLSFADIDQWVLHLSRNGVKELVLDMCDCDDMSDSEDMGDCEVWRVPSCLFNCKGLIHLELQNCEFYMPSTFKGFLYLKKLVLHNTVIPTEFTESLISNCPLLETLSLSCIDNSELHIDAPRLKHLTLGGQFKDIVLVNTPLLVTADISMFWCDEFIEHVEVNHGRAFDRFLGSMPLIESLEGDDQFTKYLSMGHDFKRFPIIFNHLKILTLCQVDFKNIIEINGVLQFLVSSPILDTFTIDFDTCKSGDKQLEVSDWDEEHNLTGRKLGNLRNIEVINLKNARIHLQFVQFLLEWSPVLETFKIETFKSIKTKMLMDLLRFRRASSRAEIIVLPKE